MSFAFYFAICIIIIFAIYFYKFRTVKNTMEAPIHKVIEKLCIICDLEANEVGSHFIPASIIKNCVGKHYKEESYLIDAKKSEIDTYFGRDNMKNQSTEIKENHYKRDHILCKECEKLIGLLESKFSTEFLSKFRNDKYKANFRKSVSKVGLEFYEPNKLSNIEILAYFYSIIYRSCKVYEMEGMSKYLKTAELKGIKKFVHGYLYNCKEDFTDEIKEFKVSVIFDKTSDKSLHIGTSNTFTEPYVFFFCDAILQLYTGKVSEKHLALFEEALNDINQEQTKIIVAPPQFYQRYSKKFTELLAGNFIENGIKEISNRNGKSFDDNMIEYKALLGHYKSHGKTNPSVVAMDDLREKYPFRK